MPADPRGYPRGATGHEVCKNLHFMEILGPPLCLPPHTLGKNTCPPTLGGTLGEPPDTRCVKTCILWRFSGHPCAYHPILLKKHMPTDPRGYPREAEDRKRHTQSNHSLFDGHACAQKILQIYYIR